MPYLSKAYSDILVFWVDGRQITLDMAIKNEEYFLMLLDKGNIPINFLSNNQRFIRLNEQDIEPLKIQYKNDVI